MGQQPCPNGAQDGRSEKEKRKGGGGDEEKKKKKESGVGGWEECM